uniref:CopG family transcriptional regulator n=1 Tax=Wolbachia endosymbiont of Oeneis ivallda TaxID=3171168 RepID=A0AAU7YNF6_9RICK
MANLAFSKETLQHLAELSELTKQPAQELAEKLLKEAIKIEIEDFLVSKISDERDVEGAETVDFEDIKWD